MPSALTRSIANHISTFAHSAKRSRKQWCLRGLTLVIMLALAAVLPAAQAQTLTVLHSFTQVKDGGFPSGTLVNDRAGNLYGTTQFGGRGFHSGTVFKLAPTGKEEPLYSFAGQADGGDPYAGVIRDAAGNLYGTAQSGGNFTCAVGCGTVFKVDPHGRETVLYSFTGPPDGSVPVAGLVRDAQGNFYGTTVNGGDASCNNGIGCGTVFKLDASNNETVLYTFTGGADGKFPLAALIRDPAGNLIGTTVQGGAVNGGTVFKLDATGKETVLHSFTGGGDGAAPFAGLALVGSNLYGTSGGGTYGYGTVFKVDKTGTETVVYSFTGGGDGGYLFAGVVSDGAGNLYGTTEGGGAFFYGTVFKLDKDGTETVLHSFTGGADGANPYGGLIRDAAGNLYGTTDIGGAPINSGTVFKITP